MDKQKEDKQKIEFKINDFKTIRKIDNLNLYKNQINYFIGENNSGKTNIFKAIIHLKENQPNSFPIIDVSHSELTDSDLETNIELKSKYNEKEINNIKEIIKKLKGIEINLEKTDYAFEIKNQKFSSKILEILSTKFEKLSYWKGYLNLKKVNKLMDLFENDNNFELDTNSESPIIKDNKELKHNLNLLQKLLILLKKEIIIYHSGQNFDIKNEYDLRDLLKKTDDPSYNSETKDIINYLTNNTNTSFQDAKELVQENDISKKSNLRRKLGININQKLNKIFNKYFENELNSEIKINFNDKTFNLEITSIKNFHFNDIKTKNSSDGMQQIIYSLFRLEILKYKLNQKPNNVYIFLVDEPEKNINPLIQEKLIFAFNDIIKDLNKTSNFYIAITTHSMSLLPLIDLQNVPSHINFVEREPELETHILKGNDYEKISKANKYLIEKSDKLCKKEVKW